MKPYYEHAGITIYHGDALDILPDIAGSSVGAVILDPPYSFESLSVRGRDDGAAGASGSPVRLLVVDPFAGLGASGISAVNCGHQWIGVEVSERFCEIAAKRLSQDVLPLMESEPKTIETVSMF